MAALTMMRLLRPVLAALALAAATPGLAQQPDTARSAPYTQLWYRAAIALTEIIRLLPPKDIEPDAARLARLADPADRLEDAVSRLIRAMPPEDGAAMHAAALPRMIRIVGYVRAVQNASDTRDKAALQGYLAVLAEEYFHLQTAMARAKDISAAQ